MATSTTNLGLTKPAGTDKIRIAQINGNMDILDDKIGAVGNTSLQAQITSQNEAIANNEGAMAYIVGNTNTTGATLAVGQFVYVKGHSTIAEGLYKVTSSISANGSITSSNTSACSDGGLNALNSKIDTMNSVKLNRYAYTILGNKGVKIGYDANMPVIISVQRPNAYARLILVGGGYGGEWIRNDFVELISSPAYTWCLSSGGGIDVMNSSGNDANLQVISPGSITFTEITALSGTADTSHVVALKSEITDVTYNVVEPVGGYFTKRDAFRAKIKSGSAVIESYINITTQIPANTEFASIATTGINGSYIAINTSSREVYYVALKPTGRFASEVAIPVGYYYFVGCAL